jgi:hypothetical protein
MGQVASLSHSLLLESSCSCRRRLRRSRSKSTSSLQRCRLQLAVVSPILPVKIPCVVSRNDPPSRIPTWIKARQRLIEVMEGTHCSSIGIKRIERIPCPLSRLELLHRPLLRERRLSSHHLRRNAGNSISCRSRCLEPWTTCPSQRVVPHPLRESPTRIHSCQTERCLYRGHPSKKRSPISYRAAESTSRTSSLSVQAYS